MHSLAASYIAKTTVHSFISYMQAFYKVFVLRKTSEFLFEYVCDQIYTH